MLKSKSTVMNLLTVLAVFAMLLAGCSAPADAPAGEAAPAAEEASDGGEEAADAGDGEMAPYLIGMAGYRTGAFQHTGTPVGNGAQDYTTLVNKMGGIDGWPVELHEIETGYETPRGVEAYERVKAAGNMIAFYPFSTGTTYAVTPSAFEDKIPILHAGYGISAAANGEAFPYNFLATPTYWTVEASTVQFIVDQVGEEAMADQKIAMVYVDIDYGRETLPLMEVLSEELGFELQKFPIEWPGLEQSAIWTDIARRSEPDWVILRTWGQSTVVSLQEAARVGFDMGSIIGCPWSPTDQDIELAGKETAVGVKANYFTNSGTDIPVIQQLITEIHDTGEAYGPTEEVGSQLYNRGVYQVALTVEAIRLAAAEFGHPVNGEQVKWGFEQLTSESLDAVGLTGLVPPTFGITAENHMGTALARVHEFDGEKMVPIGDWTSAYEDLVGGLIVEAAEAFMAQNPELYEASE